MSASRPTSVVVISVISLAFSAFGWCGFAMSVPILLLDPSKGTAELAYKPFLESDALRIWTQASLVLGMVASIALVAAAIGMLKLRPWARSTALVWATYSIVAAIVGTAFSLTLYMPSFDRHLAEADPAMQTALRFGALGGLVAAGCSGLVLPIAMWIVLTRPAVVAAFRGEPAPPVAAN
jgi:hypothetical protein